MPESRSAAQRSVGTGNQQRQRILVLSSSTAELTTALEVRAEDASILEPGKRLVFARCDEYRDPDALELARQDSK